MNKEPYKPTGFADLGEDTVLGLSIKSIIAMAVGISFFIGLYYSLNAGIEEAKLLPPPEVTKADHLVLRQTVEDTKEKIDKMDKKLDNIQDKLFELK